MITAARIGLRFRLDPALVLAEPDPLKVLVRIAAAQVCHDDEQAAEKGKAGGMSAADVAGLPDEDI